MKTNKLQKRLKNLKKAFTNYGKAIRKATSKFHGEISKSLALFFITITLFSCGSTKVSVSKPSEGTCTTITVTTNNPIQTNINPKTDVKL